MGLNLGLIDYGMGNLHSVEKAFNRLGYQPVRVGCSDDLDHCDALVLPGVGSFDPAMENLHSTGLVPDLKRWNEADRPILGRVESRRPSSGTWVHPRPGGTFAR